MLLLRTLCALLVLGTAALHASASTPAWLTELESPAVFQELRRLADTDEAAEGASEGLLFTAGFGPNSHLATPRAEDWQALPLMNKGVLLPEGCSKAPTTCETL